VKFETGNKIGSHSGIKSGGRKGIEDVNSIHVKNNWNKKSFSKGEA